MFSQELLIKNNKGLGSRAAAMFINKASSYNSTIMIEKDEKQANAKSLLGILSLSVAQGTKIKIIADGADEKQAVSELVCFLDENN